MSSSNDFIKLSREKYQELLAQEGDTLPLYLLYALHWAPPRPPSTADLIAIQELDNPEDVDLTTIGLQSEFSIIYVQLLNVDRPAVYSDEMKELTYIILPSNTELIDYAMCSAVSIESGAWAYRLQPRYWDADDPDDELKDTKWYFKPYPENLDLGN